MNSAAKEIALSIVRRLSDAGFTAYFAGGWVRDFLMGQTSEEIDIATSAPPDKILSLFPKTIAVGISFGVVIVVEEKRNFEVTTFRKDHPYHDGRHPEGVDFSTPQKDALRRDFTINGMFYDPLTDRLYDYVEGQKDIERKLIRSIGESQKRFEEDRLRMLRAIRFAHRFGFTIEEKTKEAIADNASTLFPSVSIERIVQELTKMSAYKSFGAALLDMHTLGLLTVIFPQLDASTLKQKVAPFPYFPLDTPLLAYLMELFPTFSLKEHLEMVERLKCPNSDKQLVSYLFEAKELIKKGGESVSWAHFYAHPYSSLALTIAAAKIASERRPAFFAEHKLQQQTLEPHIKRILERRPLVSAADLQKEGIPPGVILGQLLRLAEKISINEDLQTVQEVVTRLKQTALWP